MPPNHNRNSRNTLETSADDHLWTNHRMSLRAEQAFTKRNKKKRCTPRSRAPQSRNTHARTHTHASHTTILRAGASTRCRLLRFTTADYAAAAASTSSATTTEAQLGPSGTPGRGPRCSRLRSDTVRRRKRRMPSEETVAPGAAQSDDQRGGVVVDRASQQKKSEHGAAKNKARTKRAST